MTLYAKGWSCVLRLRSPILCLQISVQLGQEAPGGSEACSWFLSFFLICHFCALFGSRSVFKASHCLVSSAAPNWAIGSQVLQVLWPFLGSPGIVALFR